eukprot:gene8208-16880_t
MAKMKSSLEDGSESNSSIDDHSRPSKGLLKESMTDPMLERVTWIKKDDLKYSTYLFFSICTGGLLALASILSPKLNRWLTTSKCIPNDATMFTVIDNNSNLIVSTVGHFHIGSDIFITVEINCQRYFLVADGKDILKKVDVVPKDFKNKFITNRTSDDELIRSTLAAHYGPNSMTLPDANFIEILTKQIFHPFYVFQYFAVAVWLSADYVLYSIVILFITGGAVYLTTQETVFNLRRLRELAGKDETILREVSTSTSTSTSTTNNSNNNINNIEIQTILTSTLLPGDRVIITDDMCLPCDVILIDGRAVVDESMLTGESVPVTKQPFDISENEIDAIKNASNILFSGTKILSASGGNIENNMKGCVAIVFRTGFRSAKGQLIASLLNPKKEFLAFFSDALVVIVFMICITIVLYLWTATYLMKLHLSWGLMVMKFLDAITIAVPPALTASLTVATAVCVDRLRIADIFVSDTARLNWAGVVNAVCFDKTGTLTEERLDFCGVNIYTKSNDTSVEYRYPHDIPPQLALEVMGTCHGLSLMNDNLVGDPLEKELLRSSQWTLQLGESGIMHVIPYNTSNTTSKYVILRHFDFSPEKLRAASLIKRPNGDIVYVVKGSPEAILRLSKSDGIPSDINMILTQLGRRGFRVIAMAYCLAFLSSKLKNDTKRTMEKLHAANIYTNMITGDHVYTAVAVAKDCGLILDKKKLFIIDLNTMTNDIQIQTIDGNIALCSDLMNIRTKPVDIESCNELNISLLAQYLTNKLNNNNDSNNDNEEDTEEIQLAITGQALQQLIDLWSSFVPILMRNCQVFARMKPKDKKMIVESLMRVNAQIRSYNNTSGMDSSIGASSVNSSIEPGALLLEQNHQNSSFSPSPCNEVQLPAYKVMFCGDGANDMAALRASTVGVSLCDAETSVAAPVTSKLQTPGAVIDVLREGRSSLVTAYVLVNFNIMYGVIQLFMTCQMYSFGLAVGNYMYLIQDLLFTLVLGIAITLTPASPILSVELPPHRFFTRHLIMKLFSQLICFPIFQSIALAALRIQPWYTRFHSDEPLTETYSFESSTLSSIALAQLMIASVASTIDAPFRLPWYKNNYHISALLGLQVA